MKIMLVPFQGATFHRILTPFKAMTEHHVDVLNVSNGINIGAKLWDYDLFVIQNPEHWAKEFIEELLIKKKRFVLDIDRLHSKHPDNIPARWLMSPLDESAFIFAVKHAAYVMCSSPEIVNYLKEYTPHIAYVPTGIDNNDPVYMKGLGLRKRFKRRSAKLTYMLYANNLTVEDVDLIRPVIGQIIAAHDAHLIITDESNNIRDMALADMSDRVQYVKKKAAKEMAEFIAVADIVIFPLIRTDHNDAMDETVMIEAGVYGIPVICSKNPASKRFELRGKCFTFNPDSKPDIYAAFEMASTGHLKYREKVFNAVHKHYTLEESNKLRKQIIKQIFK